MHYTVYKITSIINGKYYIGKHQTKDLNDGYMGSGKILKRAISKHGIANFTKEILFVFDNEQQMNEKESELVVVSEDTYNVCPGGKGGFGYINDNGLNEPKKGRHAANIVIEKKYGVKNPGLIDEVRKKNSETQKKKYKMGLAPAHLGSFLWDKELQTKATNNAKSIESVEKKKKTYEKIKHQQGNKNSQYGTIWITNGIENRKIKKCNVIPVGWYKGRIKK